MGKYLIGQKVTVWDMGETFEGTIHSVRKTMFGRIKYVVANEGYDPDGIGKEKHRYLSFDEENVSPTQS